MEEMLLKELNRQVAIRIKDRLEGLLSVMDFIEDKDIEDYIEIILSTMTDKFNKRLMKIEIKKMVIELLNDKKYKKVEKLYFVNNDKESIEMFEKITKIKI